MNAHLKQNIAPPKGQVVEATDLKERAQAAMQKLISDDTPEYDRNLIVQTLEELNEYSDIMKDIRHLPKVSVFGGARYKEGDELYKTAYKMGKVLAANGYKVVTGAGPGAMQAAHEGAGVENAVGFNINLPFEQSANPIIEGSRHLVSCKYFFTRKVMFLRESDAIIACPGGLGTMDELFEALTLTQTGKTHPVPIVLLEEKGCNYWDSFMGLLDTLEEIGAIAPHDKYLFRRFDNAEDALDYINNFYRRYHSVRFVDNKLVIRLKTPLPEKLYKDICEEYAYFIGENGLVYGDALEGEKDQPDILNLPRLIMDANKKYPMDLYLLIRSLNRDVSATSTRRQDRRRASDKA